jgi:ATP phosphoribosyltransferase regulatory subunit
LTAETARQFAALEAQAQTLMSVFTAAGYEAVAPAMIQPAGVFLDVIGEALRARTYVFTDPDGDELCLRPDLTVPACRLYLERHPGADIPARYGYNGAAFRFQPVGADAAHPREFRQAGIECFGTEAPEAADAEVLGLVLESVRQAGAKGEQVRIGDLGIVHALMQSLDMPARWLGRLHHAFFRPDAFRAELARLVEGPTEVLRGLPLDLVAMLDPTDTEDATAKVAAYLADAGIEPIGIRTVDDIAEGLLAFAADAKARPLPQKSADLIEAYLGIQVPATEAAARIRDLVGTRHAAVRAALERYEARLAAMTARGIEPAGMTFAADFGRNLEYYTGFVFEIALPALGWASPVAGGGRYDRLLADVGAPHPVPAVGAAIHTERLLAAINGRSAS